ncbi:MAG: glycosyltransferase family 4 protein [Bacteroidales bacterium]|nr:glycosyltransferase family 4 protein [Bacteroidales bacterium]
MRTIIHFMGMTSTKFGGLEKFILELIDKLSNDRFVLVYDILPSSEQYLQELKDRNVVVECCSFNSKKIMGHIYNYTKILNKYNPDIVHFHFSSTQYFGAIVARLKGVKKVYKTQHSCITDKFGNQITSFSGLSMKQKFLSFWGFGNRLFTRLLFVSDYVLKQFSDIYGRYDISQRVYLGVAKPITQNKGISKNELDIDDNHTVLSSVLFSNYIKGPDVLIRAMANLDNCILILVGLDDSAYTDSLYKLAEEIKVIDKIRWIGITDNVLQYISLSDIYVQPSRTEALSLSACEALSLGKPVVGSNVGGLPEVSSRLFINGDSGDLASQIKNLISDRVSYSKCCQAAKNMFNSLFDISSGSQTYADIYNE